jgi:putative transcriptional regulator
VYWRSREQNAGVESLQGKLLVASPAIFDPNFRRTVVLVTAHGEEGAVGLVLNRPSEATVEEAVSQLTEMAGGDAPVFVGGPVNPSGVAVLAQFEDPADAAIAVVADVGFVGLEDALEAGAPLLRQTRVFAGCAGWGAGQLEGELERADWLVEPAELEDVFTPRPEELWGAVLRRKGGRYRLLATMPPDPSLN